MSRQLTLSTSGTLSRKRPAEPEEAEERGKRRAGAESPRKKRAGAQVSLTSAHVHPNYNQEITDVLKELGQMEKNDGQIHKAKAYWKAIHVLEQHPTKISSGAEAQKLEGVGKKIAQKIDEILETGKLRRLEAAKSDPLVKAIDLVSRISGVGPVAAKRFVNDLGVRSLEDMEKHRDKLNHHQRIGLKYFHDLEQRIPRDEMHTLLVRENVVKEAAHDVDPALLVECCGSFRRGLATSGDIDLLISHPSTSSADDVGYKTQNYGRKLVEALRRRHFLLDDIADGDKKYMGVCRKPLIPEKDDKKRLARRIDIRFIDYDRFYAALLYFTGSGNFNQRMRALALDKGFTINEYGIRPVGETGVAGDFLPVEKEEDIFEYIGMDYVAPQDRDI